MQPPTAPLLGASALPTRRRWTRSWGWKSAAGAARQVRCAAAPVPRAASRFWPTQVLPARLSTHTPRKGNFYFSRWRCINGRCSCYLKKKKQEWPRKATVNVNRGTQNSITSSSGSFTGAVTRKISRSISRMRVSV